MVGAFFDGTNDAAARFEMAEPDVLAFKRHIEQSASTHSVWNGLQKGVLNSNDLRPSRALGDKLIEMSSSIFCHLGIGVLSRHISSFDFDIRSLWA